jgi:site-specific DNA recombinase
MLRNEAYVGVIVYGRNSFTRDPETGNRISRPAEEDRIVHCDRPELQIVDDDVWNAVQDRLEATYETYTKDEPDRRSLNGAHRAKYLLSRLVKCDCCGAGYTLVGKDLYGCYGRKTRGASVCANGRKISRFRLEERVLARLRQGLLSRELSETFEEEVRRIIDAETANMARMEDTLQADLAKAQRAVARLLDLLESDVASDALLARLQAKEAEAKRLEAAINARADEEATVPCRIDLENVYASQLRRLDTLLSQPKFVVHANELIGQLIEEIRVRPNEDARDGVSVEIRGDLARILTAGTENKEGAQWGALPYLAKISVVAGARSQRWWPEFSCVCAL